MFVWISFFTVFLLVTFLILLTFDFSRWTSWGSESNSVAQKNSWKLGQEKINASADEADKFKYILQNSIFLWQYNFSLECNNNWTPGTDLIQVRQGLFLTDCLFQPAEMWEILWKVVWYEKNFVTLKGKVYDALLQSHDICVKMLDKRSVVYAVVIV